MDLPLEIVEEIMGHVAPESADVRMLDRDLLRTLFSCTLASRVIATAARRRLFHTLNIERKARRLHLDHRWTTDRSEQNMSQRFGDLRNLLNDEQSDLCLLIRTVRINFDGEDYLLREASNLHHVLEVLARRAVNLRRVQLGATPGRGSFPWSRIPPYLDHCLQNICLTLAIPSLRFNNISNIPTYFITVQGNTHSREITFLGSSFKQLNPDSILTSFGLNTLSQGPLCLLVFLCYQTDMSVAPLFRRVNRVYASSKSCYWLLTDDWLRHINFEIPLPVYRSISISQWYDFTSDPTGESLGDRFASAIDFLYSAQVISKLRHIDLVYNIAGRYIGEGTLTGVQCESLRALRMDSLIAKHPLVQKVTLTIIVDLMWGMDLDKECHRPQHYDAIQKRLINDITVALSKGIPTNKVTGSHSLLPEVQVVVHTNKQ